MKKTRSFLFILSFILFIFFAGMASDESTDMMAEKNLPQQDLACHSPKISFFCRNPEINDLNISDLMTL